MRQISTVATTYAWGVASQLVIAKHDGPVAERHILIVDDEELVRRVLTRALERHGFRVTQVNNGSAALEAITNAPEEHDLVLLDLSMPGALSGEDVVFALRERELSVAVLLMTGHAGPRKDVSDQVRGFIQKPVGVKELVAAVNAAIAG
jgi:DNA-binding NtrC family response regulator